MKDRIVRVGVRRPAARSLGRSWPRPIASPEPELDGVADELRQLYELYADHGDVPDALADLAMRAAEAYERVATGDVPEGRADRVLDGGTPDRFDKLH